MLLDLALLKKQVNVDYDDDDLYLSHLLESATAAVRNATNRTEVELIEMGGGEEWPAPLKHAVLMLASHWYNQREAVASVQMHEVPLTYSAMIAPYRKLSE